MKNINCGHDVAIFDNFCGECGKPVKLEACSCKATKTPNKNFCYDCGKPYSEK